MTVRLELKPMVAIARGWPDSKPQATAIVLMMNPRLVRRNGLAGVQSVSRGGTMGNLDGETAAPLTELKGEKV